MGWKSTINLTRDEAMSAIMSALENTPYDEMTNEELDDIMCSMNFGDDTKLPYYGHNFSIYDSDDKIDRLNNKN